MKQLTTTGQIREGFGIPEVEWSLVQDEAPCEFEVSRRRTVFYWPDMWLAFVIGAAISWLFFH